MEVIFLVLFQLYSGRSIYGEPRVSKLILFDLFIKTSFMLCYKVIFFTMLMLIPLYLLCLIIMKKHLFLKLLVISYVTRNIRGNILSSKIQLKMEF